MNTCFNFNYKSNTPFEISKQLKRIFIYILFTSFLTNIYLDSAPVSSITMIRTKDNSCSSSQDSEDRRMIRQIAFHGRSEVLCILVWNIPVQNYCFMKNNYNYQYSRLHVSILTCWSAPVCICLNTAAQCHWRRRLTAINKLCSNHYLI